MDYPQYENITVSPDKNEFLFTSSGPKGEIVKIVQFTRTDNFRIYNLAFGNLKSDGTLDDVTRSDNKDRNKILATITALVYEFTAKNPECGIFFCGTTPERTRLYRMAISSNLEKLQNDFVIYGVLQSVNGIRKLHFKKGVNYLGFLIYRKKTVSLTI